MNTAMPTPPCRCSAAVPSATAGLVAFAKATLRDQAVWQPFDFVRDRDRETFRHESEEWAALKARALAANPSAPWTVRVVFVQFEGEDIWTAPCVLAFETAACREELAAAIVAEARRRGLLEAGALVWNAATDSVDDLADLATIAAVTPPTRTENRALLPLTAARALLARGGQRTAPARRRLAVTA